MSRSELMETKKEKVKAENKTASVLVSALQCGNDQTKRFTSGAKRTSGVDESLKQPSEEENNRNGPIDQILA